MISANSETRSTPTWRAGEFKPFIINYSIEQNMCPYHSSIEPRFLNWGPWSFREHRRVWGETIKMTNCLLFTIPIDYFFFFFLRRIVKKNLTAHPACLILTKLGVSPHKTTVSVRAAVTYLENIYVCLRVILCGNCGTSSKYIAFPMKTTTTQQ